MEMNAQICREEVEVIKKEIKLLISYFDEQGQVVLHRNDIRPLIELVINNKLQALSFALAEMDKVEGLKAEIAELKEYGLERNTRIYNLRQENQALRVEVERVKQ